MKRVALFLAVLLAGCGVQWALGERSASVRRIGDERVSLWQVVLSEFHHMEGASVESAVRLPDGSWVLSVGGNGSRVMGIARDGNVRWQRDGELTLHRGSSGATIGVGTLGDSETRYIVRLSGGGDPLWTVETAVRGNADVSIYERAGTVVVGYHGVLQAVSLDGQPRWMHREAERTTLLQLAAAGDALFVAGAVELSDRPRNDCFARILDLDTGEVRQQIEIPSVGTMCRVERVATHRGRAVLALSDQHRGPTRTTGTSRMAIASLEPLTVELEDLEWPLQTDMALTAIPTLDVEEVVFADRYVAPPEDLGFTIVDVRSGRARRAAFVSVIPIADGTAGRLDGYMQLFQASSESDEVILAGQFTGRFVSRYGVLASDVRVIDGCAARDHVECFGDLSPVWAAPVAGVFGRVQFERRSQAQSSVRTSFPML